MNRMLPLVLFVLCGACFSGCVSHSQVDRTVTTYRANTTDLARDRFVERRSAELRRMGAFKDENENVPHTYAEREARARYGERSPDWQVKWTWKQSESPEKKSSIAKDLAEMERTARK